MDRGQCGGRVTLAGGGQGCFSEERTAELTQGSAWEEGRQVGRGRAWVPGEARPGVRGGRGGGRLGRVGRKTPGVQLRLRGHLP